jgi:zinc transporter
LPIFTVAEAGPIWACWRTPDEEVAVGDTSPPEDCTFRWLHLDLWDRRNLRWIETATDMPPLVRDLFLGQDVHPRGVAERGWVGLVLPDFEREFDRTDNGRIGALRVGIGPNLVLTGRHHPLHTPDIIRHRAAWSSAIDGTIALDLIMAAIVDTMAARAQTVATELLAIEDQVLADEDTPDTLALIAMRRLSARLHRMVAGMRIALAGLDRDPALPPGLAPVMTRMVQRLHAIDSDVAAAQSQLRLLREELDLQAGQQTNENVYLLSIITALLMPATLVTGLFGMNTGGMPFQRGAGGTFMALVMALAASGATWLILRRMGLVRR